MTTTEAPTAAKPERWTAQWKELYAEVIDDQPVHRLRGLRDLVPARRDRLRARGEGVQALPPRGRARTGRLRPWRRRAAPPAPGPARASGRGRSRPTSTCSGKVRGPTRCTAVAKRPAADPGVGRHRPPDRPGRRVRVGACWSGCWSTTTSTPRWSASSNAVDASCRGRPSPAWRRRRTRSWLPPAAATPIRQHPRHEARRSTPATSAWRSSAWVARPRRRR